MNHRNQENKAAVWDYWQKLNHVHDDGIADIIQTAFHEDVNWNGSAPIDRVLGVDALIADVWEPLLRSFPDLKRKPQVFMGGIDDGESRFAGGDGTEWVSGCGHLTGTFVKDWLGIPASGRRTTIHFGQFFIMSEGKIAESFVIFDILSVMRQAGFEVLPPSPGADGGTVPGPAEDDGILLTEQEPIASRKTIQLVDEMARGLERYVRDRDGDDYLQWSSGKLVSRRSGTATRGSGAAIVLRSSSSSTSAMAHGFGDRGLSHHPDRRVMGFIGEGSYACGGIWDVILTPRHLRDPGRQVDDRSRLRLVETQSRGPASRELDPHRSHRSASDESTSWNVSQSSMIEQRRTGGDRARRTGRSDLNTGSRGLEPDHHVYEMAHSQTIEMMINARAWLSNMLWTL